MKIHLGVVESRADPLKLGRCRVRVMGVMTDNKSELPTEDLPWAVPIQPITSAALSGIGHAPVGPVEGTWVTIVFLDGDESMQYPAMTGTIAGIPGLTTNINDVEEFDSEESEEATTQSNTVATGSGGILVDNSGTPVTTESAEDLYIGPLTKAEVDKLKDAIGKKESNGNYGAVELRNGNHLGKYQFNSQTLYELGYMNSPLPKSNVQDPKYWTGKSGIKSKEDWLRNSTVQEDAMDMELKTRAKRLGLTATTPKENAAGALATCQLGIGNAKKALSGTVTADANGTSSNTWWKIGSATVTNKQTATDPASQPLEQEQIDKDTPEAEGNKKYEVPPEKANRNAKNTAQGFVDPAGIYPLKEFVNEADTPRLARSSKLNNTIVGQKESTRIQGIPVANGGSWSQPPIPYAAKYPYNHVFQSESGHVLEFDDTKFNERINLHHKSGTFLEIDSLGNQVNKIEGSGITIIEKDGLVYIQGGGHVTVDGDFSIRAGGSCQIEVMGDANIKVAGSVRQSVGGDFNLTAGGNINMDGAQILLNSGASAPATGYSPSITQIAPVSRQEMVDMKTEETPLPAPKTAPPEEVKEEDKTQTTPVVPVTGFCDFPSLSYETMVTTNYSIRKLCTNYEGTVAKFPFNGKQHNLSDKEIACNLKHLAMNVIEPIKAKYGHLGFITTSVFREAKGSTKVSKHELGCAVDIQFTSFARNRQKYYEFAKELKNVVPFDQFLLEYRASGSVWYHISYLQSGNKSQILTLNNDKTVGTGLILVA